jgi:CRP-like cAMP-binding protein
VREILKQIPLFSELDDKELAAVATIVTSSKVRKKSVVVQEGEIGASMFIILKGSVKIAHYTADGRERVLTVLHEGSFFGEMSLLDRQPRSATVITMEDSELGQIRRNNFEQLLLQMPTITLKLLTEVVTRLRRTSLLLERISTMDVPHRLYALLSDTCLNSGKVDSDNFYSVTLPTHQLLADYLSTSRETVSRAISALKKERIIIPQQKRGEVKVDMDALETLLEAII